MLREPGLPPAKTGECRDVESCASPLTREYLQVISQGRLDYSPAPHLCQIRAPRVISSAYRARAILEAAMGNVEIHPLTADRWADFERLFGPREPTRGAGACGRGCGPETSTGARALRTRKP